MKEKISLIALGGLNEIGKNCLCLEYRNEILVLDCGLEMINKEHFGINFETPDFSYLKKNYKKIQGILITHGHLDHIGGLEYLPKSIKAPVFTTKFTAELITKRAKNLNIKLIQPHQWFRVGQFMVQGFLVQHSLIEALSYGIKTPLGTIFHTGDFRIEHKNELSKIKKAIGPSPLAVLSDSTNANKPGRSLKKQEVYQTLKKIIQRKQRIILTTFASQVERLRQVILFCAEQQKKVFVLGKTLQDNLGLYQKLKNESLLEKTLRPLSELKKYSAAQSVILCTGSQGEASAGLMKIAQQKHRQVQLRAKDVVVFSSSIIPGNEKQVFGLRNLLARHEVEVITNSGVNVHNSGHGYREELGELLQALSPKFFFPVHGERMHLAAHKQLAKERGLAEQRIFMMENGRKYFIEAERVRAGTKLSLEKRYHERDRMGYITADLLTEREGLACRGVLSVFLLVRLGELIDLSFILRGQGPNGKRERRNFLKELEKVVRERCERSGILLQDETRGQKSVLRVCEQFFMERGMKLPEFLFHWARG